MKYDFDKYIDRKNTNSFKWDTNEEFYGNEDVIPMWISDMDFPCPEPIIQAIKKRLDHKILGYTVRGKSYNHSVVNWLKKRHNWEVDESDLVYCPPGVIMAMNILIKTITRPGDKIIVQTPTYGPFFAPIVDNDRVMIENPLKIEEGRYQIDFDDLREKIDDSVKMLILCSPHNPTGRVWTRDELVELGNICLENDIFVISDEIHFDLVYKEYNHIPFGSLSKELMKNSATCFSTNKTFNLGGLQLSSLVISDPLVRERFEKALYIYQTRLDNVFGAVALEAGYNEGEDWLEQVMEYIKGNLQFAKKYIEEYIPQINFFEPEGTYFLWLDFRNLNLTSDELDKLLVEEANVALSSGIEYGENGAGFMRMNIACPRETLKTALNNIIKAICN